jgi:hypothetical protein
MTAFKAICGKPNSFLGACQHSNGPLRKQGAIAFGFLFLVFCFLFFYFFIFLFFIFLIFYFFIFLFQSDRARRRIP